MKYTAEIVYDAVATWNADPFCVETMLEVHEVLVELNNEVVEVHTEENTDSYEWETMCAQLDLRGHKVAKILRTPRLTICLYPDFE